MVDDEEANRDMLARRLERSGFRVDTVEDGARALDLLRNCEYDAVLLDSMMPGMSGSEVLRLLRAVHDPEQLPVIMVTAVTESRKIAEAIDLGANDYVTKPIDFPVALARIRSQVARKRAESERRASEERYALAARSANDGLWDWDLLSGVVYYSPRWKEMLGLENGAVGETPEEWFGRVYSDDRPELDQCLRGHLDNHSEVFEHAYRMRHQDGSCRWMLTRGLAVRDAEGRAIRMAGSQSDVTAKVTTDQLTGLGNRTLLVDRLDTAMGRFARSGQPAALLFVDLDRFKLVNDSLGHVAGDGLLRQAAMRLSEAMHPFQASAVVRLGGDEFAILLVGVEDEKTPMAAAEAVNAALRPMYRLDGRTVYCTASVGVALIGPGHKSPDEVIRDADTAMYAAKAAGKGRACLFDASMRDRAKIRLEIESEMTQAIAKGEFTVFYQPRVYLRTARICGFEALVRWRHPVRGLISPDEFIPIAEETGFINELGLWVLRESCRQMKQWQDQYPEARDFDISVNVSPRQCRDGDLVDQVSQVLKETGLAASSLQLEVTETLLLADMAEARELLNALKALGVGLKIDDFGTGYSCLRYLHQLPFDSLKIDRSFTFNLCSGDRDSHELVKTIVRMAQNLRLEAIAEGVENVEQIEYLREAGCEFGQGFYYSKPVNAGAAEELIRSQGGETAREICS